MKPRELHEVIDAMVLELPRLQEPLRHVRSSSLFAAPEVQWMFWERACRVLDGELGVVADLWTPEELRAAVVMGGPVPIKAYCIAHALSTGHREARRGRR